MGRFTEFVKSKLLEQEGRKVSSNLLKNVIDVVKEYVVTEFDLSEDEKMQVINNMEIAVEGHDKGVLKNGPRFVAYSKYNESEGESIPVEIVMEIVTEKVGTTSKMEPSEENDEPTDINIEDEAGNEE